MSVLYGLFVIPRGKGHHLSFSAKRRIPAFESSVSADKMPGFFAQFTLSGQSEILRCAQDDSEGLRMTDNGAIL
jgi:hypothetical protein